MWRSSRQILVIQRWYNGMLRSAVACVQLIISFGYVKNERFRCGFGGKARL
jgi:hypothetical protein